MVWWGKICIFWMWKWSLGRSWTKYEICQKQKKMRKEIILIVSNCWLRTVCDGIRCRMVFHLIRIKYVVHINSIAFVCVCLRCYGFMEFAMHFHTTDYVDSIDLNFPNKRTTQNHFNDERHCRHHHHCRDARIFPMFFFFFFFFSTFTLCRQFVPRTHNKNNILLTFIVCLCVRECVCCQRDKYEYIIICFRRKCMMEWGTKIWQIP